MSEYLWGPMLAGYLFLGGLAGGAYVIGALVDFFKGDDYEVLSKSGVYVSFVSIVLGLVLLILDLKRFQVDPLVILNAYRNFPGSIVSVGTWILTVFAGHLPMVGHEGDQGVVQKPPGFQDVHNPPDLVVDQLDGVQVSGSL